MKIVKIIKAVDVRYAGDITVTHKPGTLLKMDNDTAAKMVESGDARYSSKSAHKRYVKDQERFIRNERSLSMDPGALPMDSQNTEGYTHGKKSNGQILKR